MRFIKAYGDILRSGWRASPGRISLAFALLLATYLSQPLMALVLSRLTGAVTSQNVSSASTWALVLPLVALVNTTGSRVSQVVWVELSNLHMIEFTRELGALAQASAGLEHHERADYADRLSLLRHEGNPLLRAIDQALIGLCVGAQFVVTIALLAVAQPFLILLLVSALPAMLLGRLAWARLERARLGAAGRIREAAHLLDLALREDAGREIRVFGAQEELLSRQRSVRADIYRRITRERLVFLALNSVGQAIFAACYVIALFIVVRQAINGHQPVSNVVLVIILASQVNALVFRAVGIMQFLQQSAAAYERLAWLRRLTSELYPPPPAPVRAPPARLARGVDFDQMSFYYPGTDHPVLTDINLHIPAGTTVALVGENGAGKSTLVKLLCRFYVPSSGQILVDGTDLSSISMAAWRERLSAGFQDFVHLEMSLLHSVGAGDLNRRDDTAAVADALDRAGGAEVARQFPSGLATLLGNSHTDGRELSGGQWQKVALGRAMMRSSPLVLLLDEPTSALDAHSEHALFERYKHLARHIASTSGGIAVFVSHRFSTVRMADLIVVIDDGRILEQGSHDQLMARGGLYAELFSLQASAFRS